MIFFEIDPNIVKPGWTPMIITILLAAAIVLLTLSMRRQMRKVRLPSREDLGGAEESSTDQAPGDQAPGDQAPGEQAAQDSEVVDDADGEAHHSVAGGPDRSADS